MRLGIGKQMFIRTDTVYGTANVVVALGNNPAIGTFVAAADIPSGQVMHRYTWTAGGGLVQWNGWVRPEARVRYDEALRRIDSQLKEHWNEDGDERLDNTKFWIIGLAWNAWRHITAQTLDPDAIEAALRLLETTEGVTILAWYRNHLVAIWQAIIATRNAYLTNPNTFGLGLLLGTVPDTYKGWNPNWQIS